VRSLGFSMVYSEYNSLEEHFFIDCNVPLLGLVAVNGVCTNGTFTYNNNIRTNTLSCICCYCGCTILFAFAMYIV